VNEPTLERAVSSLTAVLDRIVVVGGTAHRLFPMHPLAGSPVAPLLTTEDVDFAAPLELEHDGSRELLEKLIAAGFREDVRGGEFAGHTYHLDSQGGAYLQFIAPLRGSGESRTGDAQRTLHFSGLVAERLHDIDLLMRAPWTLELDAEGRRTSIRVVNPAAFLLQKLLLIGLSSRNRPLEQVSRDPLSGAGGTKRGKDLLYIYDTIAIFADQLEALGTDSANLCGPLTPKLVRRANAVRTTLFEVKTDAWNEAVLAAKIQRSHPPTPKQMARVCKQGLHAVLGSLLQADAPVPT
jgi:hypothetical protein